KAWGKRRMQGTVATHLPRPVALTSPPLFPISPPNSARLGALSRAVGGSITRSLNKRNRARRGLGYETHIPAEQTGAHPPPRFPRPHGYQERPQGPEPPARRGPQSPVGLTHGPRDGHARDRGV